MVVRGPAFWHSVGMNTKDVGVQMSKCSQGLKFNTELHSKISVCSHELGEPGVGEPGGFPLSISPTAGNSITVLAQHPGSGVRITRPWCLKLLTTELWLQTSCTRGWRFSFYQSTALSTLSSTPSWRRRSNDASSRDVDHRLFPSPQSTQAGAVAGALCSPGPASDDSVRTVYLLAVISDGCSIQSCDSNRFGALLKWIDWNYTINPLTPTVAIRVQL